MEMPQSPQDFKELERLMKENSQLLEENNTLLKKIHRNGLIGFWVRILWYVLLIGLPFALYFYVLEPYFSALGSNFEVFKAGINEIPGWKQFTQFLDSASESVQPHVESSATSTETVAE